MRVGYRFTHLQHKNKNITLTPSPLYFVRTGRHPTRLSTNKSFKTKGSKGAQRTMLSVVRSANAASLGFKTGLLFWFITQGCPAEKNVTSTRIIHDCRRYRFTRIRCTDTTSITSCLTTWRPTHPLYQEFLTHCNAHPYLSAAARNVHRRLGLSLG